MKTIIHPEFIITPYKNGVRVAPPANKAEQVTNRMIGEIFKLKYNMYFHDLNFVIQEVNDPGWQTTGWLSREDAIQKVVTKPCTSKALAQQIKLNEARVKSEKRPFYFDECALIRNDKDLRAISIKMPWYNEEDHLKGIFGCSLLVNNISNNELIQSITDISNLFISNWNDRSITEIKNKMKFSPKQRELLYWFKRGKNTREIASIMCLSYRTVEHYIANIKDKIGINSKSELLDILNESSC